jgi:hypothetical protein
MDDTDTFDPYAGAEDFDCGDLLADVAGHDVARDAAED